MMISRGWFNYLYHASSNNSSINNDDSKSQSQTNSDRNLNDVIKDDENDGAMYSTLTNHTSIPI